MLTGDCQWEWQNVSECTNKCGNGTLRQEKVQKYPPKDVWECEIEAKIDVKRDVSCHDSSECPSK